MKFLRSRQPKCIETCHSVKICQFERIVYGHADAYVWHWEYVTFLQKLFWGGIIGNISAKKQVTFLQISGDNT